mgnify:FL=1|jgi:hypothetical protein
MSNYVVIIPVEEKKTVLVSQSEAEILKKVYRILSTGKNVEIRRDVDGKPKVFKVSREIEK